MKKSILCCLGIHKYNRLPEFKPSKHSMRIIPIYIKYECVKCGKLKSTPTTNG
jgi:hypothetical protein